MKIRGCILFTLLNECEINSHLNENVIGKF